MRRILQDKTMTHYLFLIVGAVLVNNVVLVRILGLCPFMGFAGLDKYQ